MRRAAVALFLSMAWAAVPVSLAKADGLIRDGIGAISIGRGGTNLGFADNAVIILDNPAGMSNVEGCGLVEVGMDTVYCNLEYSDADNFGVGNEFKLFPSGAFGYINNSPDTPWSWGVGVFAPAGFGGEFELNNPHTGPIRYKSLGILAKVLPAVSLRVTDRLSVGASLGLAACHAELEGPFYSQTGPLPGAPSILDMQHTGVAATGGVGLQYKLTPCTTVGVAYTEETRFTFDGDARATLLLPDPIGPVATEFDARTRLAWPRSLGIGVKHELGACRRIAVAVIWYDWSSAFDQLSMRLSNASNPLLGLLGLPPVINESFPMNWEDTVSVRVGYEWSCSPLTTLRAGYVYHDSPVPDSTLNPYVDGVLEHAVSVGMSHWYEGMLVSLAYQANWGPERNVGASDILGGDFENSSFEAMAHWFGLSVVLPR
jgi:long-chain fatty acid transport protein